MKEYREYTIASIKKLGKTKKEKGADAVGMEYKRRILGPFVDT